MLTKGNEIKVPFSIATLTLYTDKTATLAEVTLSFNGETLSATGNSWRMTGDKYDEEAGNTIAVYRAVQQLENMLFQAVQNLEV